MQYTFFELISTNNLASDIRNQIAKAEQAIKDIESALEVLDTIKSKQVNMKLQIGTKTIESWYDQQSRSFVTQLKDQQGNQIGEAAYDGNSKSRTVSVNEFIDDNQLYVCDHYLPSICDGSHCSHNVPHEIDSCGGWCKWLDKHFSCSTKIVPTIIS